MALLSLGPYHQRRHKSRVSLQGPPCARGVSGTPHGEVRDIRGELHDIEPRVAKHNEDCLIDDGISTIAIVESEMCDIISKMLSNHKHMQSIIVPATI